LNTNLLFKESLVLTRDANDVETTIVDFCLNLHEEETSFLVLDENEPNLSGTFSDELKRVIHARWVGEDAFDQLSWQIKLPSFAAVLLGASLIGVLTK
jgi:hypothetical protein